MRNRRPIGDSMMAMHMRGTHFTGPFRLRGNPRLLGMLPGEPELGFRSDLD
jgi:hypothetical protein